MIQIANGEAVSIAQLMETHNELERRLNRASKYDDNSQLDAEFHQAINALLKPGLECISAEDALAVVKYAHECFRGDDNMFDHLMPLVVRWLEHEVRRDDFKAGLMDSLHGKCEPRA